MVKRFLYLNGLAIFGAVMNHASAWGFIALFWWTDRYLPVSVPNFDALGSPTYYSLRMIEQYIINTIPIFLFVSGYFVAFAAGRTQKTVGWRVIFTRIRTLAIPFIIWSAIILLGQILQGQTYTLVDILVIIITGQAAPPYYFVPVLIQLYLLAPFLVPIARNRWRILLLAALIIQFIAVGSRYWIILGVDFPLMGFFRVISRSVLFTTQIFWFSLGMVVGFHLASFKGWLIGFRWVFLVSVLFFYLSGIIEWETLLHASGQAWIAPKETLVDHLYAASFILAFLSFQDITLPFSRQLADLGARSYGVYLIHQPVQEYAAKAIYHLAPGLLAHQIIFQPLLIVLGLAVPLVMMTLVDRSSARRYYEYAFGK